jgi:Ca2+/Na+ antiporter
MGTSVVCSLIGACPELFVVLYSLRVGSVATRASGGVYGSIISVCLEDHEEEITYSHK